MWIRCGGSSSTFQGATSGGLRTTVAVRQAAAGGGVVSFEVGQKDGFRVAYDDICDLAPSVDQDAYLPVDFVR